MRPKPKAPLRPAARLSARRVADFVKATSRLRPQLAIVLGSGFRKPCLRIEAELPYIHLPGFPVLTVRGHEGKLLLGELKGTPIMLLCGRAHYYEGYSMEAITFPIRVLAKYGIRHLVLTNAAGGINPKFRPGDFMLIRDHINFMPENPLRGELPDKMAGHTATRLPRFVDLTRAYDPGLNRLLRRAALRVNMRLHAGVYLAVSGPSYETPAEIRAFARLGADAVGMSTVPEAIIARQHGLTVAGLSCITNLAAGRSRTPLSHTEVLEMGLRMEPKLDRFFEHFAEIYRKNASSLSPADA
jgi:purine-nucleoside phosphorylase